MKITVNDLRLLACDCAELALARVKEPDPRSTEAVRVARAYANGEVTVGRLGVAAWDAARAARDAVSVAVRVARGARVARIARAAAWATAGTAAIDEAVAASLAARAVERELHAQMELEYLDEND